MTIFFKSKIATNKQSPPCGYKKIIVTQMGSCL